MYKIISQTVVFRIIDNCYIPITDETYIKWLSEGNTPESEFTDEELAANQKAKAISDAKSLLSSTDWILSKYTDLVVVQKLMTDADFNTKYA
ncbi:MAG: hypothetical protein JHC33_10630, partial [Ignisphaera sp.]|nr:hypothetical protein [Ignisphaera sp.]